MANRIKNAASELGEAMKPAVDEAGKMLEQGAQSIIGQYPAASQNDQAKEKREYEQRQADDQKKMRMWQNFVSQVQANENRQRQLKADEEQKKQQKIIEENQQKQVKQFKIEQKKQQLSQNITEAQRKTEQKKGVGG